MDSKSTGLFAHAGSIPAFGTIICKEHNRKIAIRQYSMILMAIRITALLYAQFGLFANIAFRYTGIFPALMKHEI
ncbi:MAG TPA: hypothetical protein DHW79_03405 [Candidatus Cloacimonas sp.]|nr:hypothetical protein [Candidatus Cloacimonas sp.]